MSKTKFQNKPAFFRVHTARLLEEIVSCAIPQTSGVLFVPLNTFRLNLIKVAERASQLNDPLLNKAMADLTLYDEVDPYSKDYDPLALKRIYKAAEEQNKAIEKLNKKS